MSELPSTPTARRRRSFTLGGALLIVAIAALSIGPGPLPGLAGGSAPAPTSAHIASVPGVHLPGAARASAAPVVASKPNGMCGIATWCPPVQGNGTFFSSVATGLLTPSLTNRVCSINVSGGACTTAASGGASVEPYLNATNNVALNYSSTGTLGMAYTNYTSLPPTGAASCSPARPAATSEVTFTLSTNRGLNWAPPTLLGTPQCQNATNYPSAYDPALTSLGNGTFVLAYVQYKSDAPYVPPFLNITSPPVSRLVVTELYPGHTQWTNPVVVNSSKTPQVAFQYAPTRPSIAALGKTIYLTWMSLGDPVYPIVYSHVAMRVSTSSGKSWSPTIQIGPGYTSSANPNVLVSPSNGELFIAFVTDIGYCGYNYYCPGVPAGTPWYGDVEVDSSTYNGTSFNTAYVAGVQLNATFGPFFNPDPLLAWGNTSSVLDLAFIAGVQVDGYQNGQVVSYGAYTPDLYFYTSFDGGVSFNDETYVSQQAIFPTANLWGGLSNSTELLDLALTPQFGGNLALEATVFNGSTCAGKYCGVEYTVALNTSDNGSTWSAPYVISGAVSTNGTTGGWRSYLTGEYMSAIQLGSVLYAWDAPSCPTFQPPTKVAAADQCGVFTGSTTYNLWGTTEVTLSRSYHGPTLEVKFTANQKVPANATWTLEMMGEEFVANGSANVTVLNVPSSAPILFNATGPGIWQSYYQYTVGTSNVSLPASFSSNATAYVGFTFAENVALTVQQLPSILDGRNCNAQYYSFYSCPLFTPPPGPTFADLNPYNCDYIYCYNPPPGASSSYTYDLGCVQMMYPDVYNDSPYFWEDFGDWYGVGCEGGYVTHNVSGAAVSIISYGQKTWMPIGQKYTLGTNTWNPAQVLCDPMANGPGWWVINSFWYIDSYCYTIFTLQLEPEAWFGNGTGSVTSTAASITVTPTGPVNETVDWNITGSCQGSFAYNFAYGYYTQVYYNYTSLPTCKPGNPYLKGAGAGGVSGFDVPLSVNETGLPTGTPWGVTFSGGGNTFSKSTVRSSFSVTLLSGNTYVPAALTVPIPKTGQYWVGTTNSSVTMPNFYGITVVYTIQSLASDTFTAGVSTVGLPKGLEVTVSVNDTTTGNSTDYLLLSTSGGGHGLAVPTAGGQNYSVNSTAVTAANGTKYYLSSVNVTVHAINGTSGPRPLGQQTFTAIAATTVILDYSPAYYINVQATIGGSVSPTSGYVHSGQKVNLTATPAAKYQFVGWVGNGNGSVSSLARTIAIKPSNSLTEFAVFRPIAAPTYNLTVQETGLPLVANYSLAIDGAVYSGSGNFVISNVTGGNHSVSAPVTYGSYPGSIGVNIQYSPTGVVGLSTTTGPASGSLDVQADAMITVDYATDYLLTLENTSGGSIGGGVNGAWEAPATPLTLTAVPEAGFEFVQWNGTGTGSYSGPLATIPVTMNSPVSEFAEFIRIPPPSIPKYTVNITEQGLPAGTAWNVTVGSVGGSGTTSLLAISGLLDNTYVVTVPTVYGAAGIRYEPNGMLSFNASEKIDQNRTLTDLVRFTTQYELTVLTSGNGTVTGATQWEDANTTVSLTAVPNATRSGQIGWKLASWNSTSAGLSNGTALSYSFMMKGPVTVEATFVPAYQQKTTTLTFLGAPEAIGLLAGLLLVGLIVAFALGRRRRGGGQAAAPPAAEEAPMTYEAPSVEAPSQHEEDWSETTTSA
jgi:hypothetical protein